MEKTCETCYHYLGGIYNMCRINLEAECADGDREAWEPRDTRITLTHRRPRKRAAGSAALESAGFARAGRACAEAQWRDCYPAQETARPTATLLTAEGFAARECGVGWQESQYDDGEIDLQRIAWADGNTVTKHGHSTVAHLLKYYGRPRGVRVWIGDTPPTDEQRQAVKWG